jgi:protein SMG6
MAISTSPRSSKSPHVVVSRPTVNPDEADHEDFSRRLKISNSTSRHHYPASSKSPNLNNGKLFNPETDPIPLRTAEPESMSESDSYAPRGGNAQRQLFNHRKDDPVRFSVLARPSAAGRPPPTPKSSGEYISASSTSSYAQSSLSSTFTLSSNTTDDSSANSALFERERKETGNNAFAVELKRLYRGITCLEGKITQQDSELDGSEEAGRVLLKGRPGKEVRDEDAEQQKWKKVIHDHKQCVYSQFLSLPDANPIPYLKVGGDDAQSP